MLTHDDATTQAQEISGDALKIRTIEQALRVLVNNGTEDETVGSVDEDGVNVTRVEQFLCETSEQGFFRVVEYPGVDAATARFAEVEQELRPADGPDDDLAIDVAPPPPVTNGAGIPLEMPTIGETARVVFERALTRIASDELALIDVGFRIAAAAHETSPATHLTALHDELVNSDRLGEHGREVATQLVSRLAESMAARERSA